MVQLLSAVSGSALGGRISFDVEHEGTCVLCLRSRKLVKGHVIPRYCGKFLRSDTHGAPPQMVQVVFGKRPSYSSRTQSTRWNYFLCQECDGDIIGSHETYFSRAWTPGLFPAPVLTDAVVIPGFDYAHFKLLHLAVLWKNAASHAMSPTDLGPYYEEIRRMLLEGDPGPPEDFAVWGSLLLEDDRTVNWQQAGPPMPHGGAEKTWHPPSFFQTWYCGAAWHVCVPESGDVEGPVIIRPASSLTLLASLWKEMPVARALAKKWKADGLS
jgi:hypothetical protein